MQGSRSAAAAVGRQQRAWDVRARVRVEWAAPRGLRLVLHACSALVLSPRCAVPARSLALHPPPLPRAPAPRLHPSPLAHTPRTHAPRQVLAGAQLVGDLLGQHGLLQAAAWRERAADRGGRLLVRVAASCARARVRTSTGTCVHALELEQQQQEGAHAHPTTCTLCGWDALSMLPFASLHAPGGRCPRGRTSRTCAPGGWWARCGE